MFNLVARIEIEQQGAGRADTLYLDKVSSCTIDRSYDQMTQTARVILPRNLKYQNRNIYEGENPLIRRGDKVRLTAGYFPNAVVLFAGYISKINNNVPIELLCEDEMYNLKQMISPNLSYNSSVTLSRLLRDMLGASYPFQAITATLGSIRINGANVSKVLELLRNDYGLYSFFVDGVLKVGFAYYPDVAISETFLFERSMIADGMNLIYLKRDDVRVQIEGIIIHSDNTRSTYIYGDTTGDKRTVFQYGGDKEQLDITCNSFLEQANYTGYYGDFTTFLEPTVYPGDYAVIDSYKYPERKGTYLIKSVTTSFGVDGGRQKIELERKIA